MQPHRSRENLVYEAAGHNERSADHRLSATTIFPYTDPKEGFAILVSYEAKVGFDLVTFHEVNYAFLNDAHCLKI